MDTNFLPVWKQRDGKRILISTMEDEHILNCMRMVQRNAKSLYPVSYYDKEDIEGAISLQLEYKEKHGFYELEKELVERYTH